MEKNKYICIHCDKIYKNYKSLWKHNYIYHKSEDKPILSNDKSDDKPYDKPMISQNEIKKIDSYKCKFCNNIYKHFQSRWKHEQKCSDRKEYNINTKDYDIKKKD